jgi:hypothetical protein
VVDADRLLGDEAMVGNAMKLVVLGGAEGAVAVAVGQILDVLPAESQLQSTGVSTGVSGLLALGGMATEVLDVSRGLPW